jgi:hypothetical protein
MSDMTSTSSSNKIRQRMSHEQDLQNSFVLSNMVANVAVFASDASLRQRQLQRTSTNVIREFWVRKRRHVGDIYKELEPVFFKEGVLQLWDTCWWASSIHCIRKWPERRMSIQQIYSKWTNLARCPPCMCDHQRRQIAGELINIGCSSRDICGDCIL